jgi:hypothetical protein
LGGDLAALVVAFVTNCFHELSDLIFGGDDLSQDITIWH